MAGRKVNPCCSSCGELKTDDNTYRRKSGLFCNECKDCARDRIYQRTLAKDSTDTLLKKVRRVKRMERFIYNELRRREE